jgi:hypothetical protein
MIWREAVDAMRAGKHVRRASEVTRKLIDGGDGLNPPIYDCGTEGCFLAAAWSVDDRPVSVFMGSWSKVPFVPGDEHMQATDWIEVEP